MIGDPCDIFFIMTVTDRRCFLIFDLQLWFRCSSRCRIYISIKFNLYSVYQPNNLSYFCCELCKRQNNLLFSWQFPITSSYHLRKHFDFMWFRYSKQKINHEKSSHLTLIPKREIVPLEIWLYQNLSVPGWPRFNTRSKFDPDKPCEKQYYNLSALFK